MRHQRGKDDDTSCADWNRQRLTAVVLAAYVAKLGLAMRQCSAQMASRNYPRTSVVNGRVGQREPARQVCLRFDVGVAVVLMPRERFWIFRFFVDRLMIPSASAMNILRSGLERRNSSVCASKGSIASRSCSIAPPSIASSSTKNPRSLNDRACPLLTRRSGPRTCVHKNLRFSGCSAGIASLVDGTVLKVLEPPSPGRFSERDIL